MRTLRVEFLFFVKMAVCIRNKTKFIYWVWISILAITCKNPDLDPGSFFDGTPKEEVAERVNTLAFSLFSSQIVDFESGNFVINPLNHYLYLTMLHDGSKGITKKQLEQVLGFSNNTDNILESVSNLTFNIRTDFFNDQMDFQLHFFKDQDIELEPFFFNSLSSVDNDIRVEDPDFDVILNFTLTQLVNNQITDYTDGQINGAFSESTISPNNKMLFINTYQQDIAYQNTPDVYSEEFLPFFFDYTERFLRVSGNVFNTPFSIINEADFFIIRIPLTDEDYSLILFVEETDINIGNYESQFFTPAVFNEINRLPLNQVDNISGIVVPNFRSRSAVQLRSMYARLGATNMFSSTQADFSGFSSAGFNINDVRATTNFSFDRNNVEGASVHLSSSHASRTNSSTLKPDYYVHSSKNKSSSIKKTTQDSDPTFILIDKPFRFIVLHNKLNMIMFMGRISNPLIS